ncbi:phospholipase D zeta 1 isoform X3 [Malania oleifera]|uniref:phospholipase D zeta 1 isoform X3 n=1 Tax=Malania oleifera TaxID=397392 RepID=UPI0025AE5251|nr:phospholipase D zeta 1 isoform X3 [Malania oleifera]
MASEDLMAGGGPRYFQMQSEPSPGMTSSFFSFRQSPPESSRIFDELPKSTIVSVSRPDAADISPLLLSYTIEFQYKQFKWCLQKKASQVFYLHFALKKRVFIEEIQEKQEQVKEWLQSLGIGDQTAVVQDDDEPDEETGLLHQDESVKSRDVPSSAALPIIKPALGRQQSISDRAKSAMQGYLNHFLGNMDIVNSREVCKFLEVSKLSFSPEYGPKLKEDYVMVKHLPKLPKADGSRNCCGCSWFDCCNDNWQKVWAVLKPGFLAFLEDPFDTKPLDLIVFDVLPASDGNGEGRVSLAKEIKERNPLRHAFIVACGNRSIKLRTRSNAKVRDWVAAINDAGLRPPEGWCHRHRFGSFAPPRGLTDDGSQAQWFVDGRAAFDAIASSIEEAKSEIFICGWWVCPELYLRRPFHSHASSRLDALLEAKAKQGVQIYILLYKEVALALKINSVYSKRKLLSIHENVRVLRYPDHFSSGVYLWSHHEKLVIVDYQICFIGGLDLCFGRYDTLEHKVGDHPPIIWPGKDYYNARESEPNSWEDTVKDELDRTKYPRMPWHDVHCALWGPPCRDIARHFVQRWNYAKVIRSVSQWSAGTSQTEESIHNAYCSLIAKAEHFVYIENQFFISGFSKDEIIRNRVLQALYERITRAYNEKKCFRVIIVIPLLPGFQGGLDDGGAASVRAIMHWQYRTICRGHNSILQNLCEHLGPKTDDYISFYGLRSYGRLFDGGPVVTSQVYVHSKMMIVDDRIVLIGSANINDRSLLGSRDSEIGVLIEDQELVDSSMGAKPWKAGKFASSLRLSLWSEHLGLRSGEINRISDPVVDSTYKDIWAATAKTNTMIYQDVFACIPNDLIHSRASLRSTMACWRENFGHTTIDLGVAPQKLESYQNGNVKETDPMERLESVRGHLVSFPLNFMRQEDLRPVFNESEYYASPQVFH